MFKSQLCYTVLLQLWAHLSKVFFSFMRKGDNEKPLQNVVFEARAKRPNGISQSSLLRPSAQVEFRFSLIKACNFECYLTSLNIISLIQKVNNSSCLVGCSELLCSSNLAIWYDIHRFCCISIPSCTLTTHFAIFRYRWSSHLLNHFI